MGCFPGAIIVGAVGIGIDKKKTLAIAATAIASVLVAGWFLMVGLLIFFSR